VQLGQRVSCSCILQLYYLPFFYTQQNYFSEEWVEMIHSVTSLCGVLAWVSPTRPSNNSLTNTDVYIMRAIARHISIFRAPIARPFLSTVARSPIAATRSIGSYRKTSATTKSFTRNQVANMSSESTQSQACCNTPAVVSKGYSPKGDYIEVDGLKTCKLYQTTV
jgi:hypothetical protein